MWLDLPGYKFLDNSGLARQFPGCSMVGKFEFDDVVDQIGQILAQSDLASQQLYHADPKFAWLCNRALELNGISLAWVGWPQIQALLFWRMDGSQTKPGYLIEINQLRDRGSSLPPKPVTLAQALAGLSLALSSFSEAVQAAQGLPADFLLDYVEAKLEFQRPSDVSPTQSPAFRDWVRRERAKK